MAKGRFVAAINFMDGRVQVPVITWLKRETGADKDSSRFQVSGSLNQEL